MKKSRVQLIIGAIISAVLIFSIFALINFKNKQVEEVAKPNNPSLGEVEKEQKDEVEQKVPDVAEEPKVQPDKNGYIPNQTLPSEPTYINGILLANKKYPLPSTYAPDVDPEAKSALDTMLASAEKDGFNLIAFSGYRSFEYQTTLYNNYVKRDGVDAADRYSARPGYSEHQTGLAFDIGEKGKEDLWLTEEFGESPAGQWLINHANEYGFILRFPKDKEHITGYMYESWHFRYVGVEVANEIKKREITLEEYLGVN